MENATLSDRQRRLFDKNGFLVVPNALSAEEIKRYERTSDRMIDALDNKGSYVQLRPGIVQEPAFHPLLTHSPAVPYIAQLLSPNIQLHTTAVIYKYPEPDSEETRMRRGWHRDAGITEDLGHANLPRVGIKAAYCLTDFHEPLSGMTLFAPGSHLLASPLTIPKGGADPEGAVDLRLNAGDLVLFENRVFHTAAPNLSDRVSKAVIFGYAYRWLGGYKEAMRSVQPDETTLEQVDPIGQQILGAGDGLARWAEEHGYARAPFEWVTEA